MVSDNYPSAPQPPLQSIEVVGIKASTPIPVGELKLSLAGPAQYGHVDEELLGSWNIEKRFKALCSS